MDLDEMWIISNLCGERQGFSASSFTADLSLLAISAHHSRLLFQRSFEDISLC